MGRTATKKVKEIKEPVCTIGNTEVFVLRDATQKWRRPDVKETSPRAWDYGPSIIILNVYEDGHTVYTIFDPDDPQVWKWISELANIGVHYTPRWQDEKSASIKAVK